MKIKDALNGMMLWLGIIAFVLVISGMDSYEDWILAVLAIVLWCAYILICIRDHERYKRRLKNPVLWMAIEGKDGVKRWTAMDGSGRTQDLNNPPPNTQPIFEQEDDLR